ncbi:hypothetical protein JX266_013015 [Neoarthrinium moseri]|nr:hypothetical protein JX266_013015 [Neoarthrinium moseri]
MAESTSASHKQDESVPTAAPFPLPRITIRFCTQCKWMLRAAYYAQELLSTFSTSLGEVALQPSTGGTFTVTIEHAADASPSASNPAPSIQQRTLWDRKVDGGFPETKELKRRVRDVIEPGRDLGHVDRDHGKAAAEAGAKADRGEREMKKTATGDAPPPGQSQEAQNTDPLRKGQSLPMIPADGGGDGIPDSRSWRGQPPHAGQDIGAKVEEAVARKAEAKAEAREACEDCQ